MKACIFLISFLFVTTGVSYAQSNVVDSHPEVALYVIDYSTGQKVLVNYDTANLFKDAFVDLVLNTDIAQRHSGRRFPGEKSLIVEQLDPQTNGNAYKLELLSKDRINNLTFTIYTFVYNADQNTLAFLNQQYQRYVPVQIDGGNQNNLNNCYSYGLFNSTSQQGSDYQATADVQDTAVDEDVSTEVAPPDMPDYQQPECPADGYLWQPGYWGYNPRINVYYWVPGAWVAPPTNDVVWTPPYWGFEGRVYIFHAGYWGPHVGFYGGINYGYGYSGHGFYGGEWRDNHYHYNTAVTRVNTTVVHNTYVNTTVINNTTIVNKRFSYNGTGGVLAKPTQVEVVAVHEQHERPTPEQNRNQQLARTDKGQFATPGGNGKPTNVAVERVPVRPVNMRGFQNNNNNNTRPGMNQPANPNGGRVGTTEPANNGMRPGSNQQPNQNGTRPVMDQPANQNNGRVGTAQPAFNNGARPVTDQPGNQNNVRVSTNEPASDNRTRPGANEPNNQNGARPGFTNPGNNGGVRPPASTPVNQPATTPAAPQNARPVMNMPANQNAPKPAPPVNTAPQAQPAPATFEAPNSNNGQKPAPKPVTPIGGRSNRPNNNQNHDPNKKPKQDN